MDTQKLTNCLLLLIFHWMPRVLSILFIIFLSIFSFDVFGQGSGFWKALAALLVNNVSSLALIVILVF